MKQKSELPEKTKKNLVSKLLRELDKNKTIAFEKHFSSSIHYFFNRTNPGYCGLIVKTEKGLKQEYFNIKKETEFAMRHLLDKGYKSFVF